MATSLYTPEQSGFAFPVPLTDKYCPTRIEDFVGLEKVKRAMSKIVANPIPTNFYFLGPSGTGKTRMALTVANLMPAELHHIASKECTIETVRDIVKQCHWMPRMFNDWKPCKMHLILADEADQCSYAAQQAFLSILDGTNRPPNTIVIFTGNSIANLEDRFMSRCHKMEFSSYGISRETAALLERVWDAETDNPVERPNFQRIVKESNNNVRESLMRLETELMCS